MKKYTLIFILIITMTNVFSQKTKSFIIWKKPVTAEVLQANYFYNANNELENVGILFMADENIKPSVTLTIYSGTPKEFYLFLIEVETFCKENKVGTRNEIHGHHVILVRGMGVIQVSINEKDKDGIHFFTPSCITKFKEKFIQWAAENKISYN